MKNAFSFLKSDLKNNIIPTIVSICDSDRVLDYSRREEVNLRFEPPIEKYPLIKEVISYLEFLENKNRKNINRRIQFKYFKGCSNNLKSYFLNEKYNILDDLVEKNKVSTKLSEKSLIEFFEFIEILKYTPKDANDLLNHIKDEIVRIKEIVETNFKRDIRNKIYLKEIRGIVELEKTIDIVKKYIDFEIFEFIEVFKSYLEKISVGSLNIKAPKVINLNVATALNLEHSLVLGFNMNYPDFGSEDVVFNKNNFDFLREMGFEILESNLVYERELINILSLILNSKKITFLLVDEDISSFSYLLKGCYYKEANQITNLTDLSLEMIKKAKKSENHEVQIKVSKNFCDYTFIDDEIKNELKNLSGDKSIYLSGKALDIVNEKTKSISVTGLERYEKSPYVFLYENIAKINDFYPEEETYYKDLGTLYHKVLEEYFKKYNDLNEEIILGLVKTHSGYTENLSISEEVYVYGVYKKLLNFIKKDLEDRKSDVCKNSKFEESVNIKIGDLNITGRIDRIDKIEDNDEMLEIIDYKSSKTPSKKDINELKSFQFPLYMKARGNIKKAKYGNIKDAKYIEVINIINEKDEQAFRSLIKQVENKICSIKDNIRCGNFTTEEFDSKYLEDLYR